MCVFEIFIVTQPQSWLLWPWRVSGSQSGRARPAATLQSTSTSAPSAAPRTRLGVWWSSTSKSAGRDSRVWSSTPALSTVIRTSWKATGGTFSCFSSLIRCSLAFGMSVKSGPDLSSSSLKFLAAGFLPGGPWHGIRVYMVKMCFDWTGIAFSHYRAGLGDLVFTVHVNRPNVEAGVKTQTNKVQESDVWLFWKRKQSCNKETF